MTQSFTDFQAEMAAVPAEHLGEDRLYVITEDMDHETRYCPKRALEGLANLLHTATPFHYTNHKQVDEYPNIDSAGLAELLRCVAHKMGEMPRQEAHAVLAARVAKGH